MRASLGASRSRIALQFLTEGVVLIPAAVPLGLGFAQIATQLLLKLIPADMMARTPYLQNASLNVHVLVFALVIAVLSAVLFAVSPLPMMLKSEPHPDLAVGDGGRPDFRGGVSDRNWWSWSLLRHWCC